MDEEIIAEKLLPVFAEQLKCYSRLEALETDSEKIFLSHKGLQSVSGLNEEKKSLLEKITVLDASIREAKDEWIQKKAGWKNSALRLSIENALMSLTNQVKKTMEIQIRINAMIGSGRNSPAQAAANRYKKAGL